MLVGKLNKPKHSLSSFDNKHMITNFNEVRNTEEDMKTIKKRNAKAAKKSRLLKAKKNRDAANEAEEMKHDNATLKQQLYKLQNDNKQLQQQLYNLQMAMSTDEYLDRKKNEEAVNKEVSKRMECMWVVNSSATANTYEQQRKEWNVSDSFFM